MGRSRGGECDKNHLPRLSLFHSPIPHTKPHLPRWPLTPEAWHRPPGFGAPRDGAVLMEGEREGKQACETKNDAKKLIDLDANHHTTPTHNSRGNASTRASRAVKRLAVKSTSVSVSANCTPSSVGRWALVRSSSVVGGGGGAPPGGGSIRERARRSRWKEFSAGKERKIGVPNFMASLLFSLRVFPTCLPQGRGRCPGGACALSPCHSSPAAGTGGEVAHRAPCALIVLFYCRTAFSTTAPTMPPPRKVVR